MTLPTGWKCALLSDLVGRDGFITDGDWVETKDQNPEGEVRLTQLADVGDGQFRDRSSRFMTRARADELRCTYLAGGDVLIARMPDPLGRACVFPQTSRSCVSVVDVCIVRTGGSGVEPRWLMYAVNSPEVRRVIAAQQQGSTRKRISKSRLLELSVPVPPRAEQIRIVEALDMHFTRLDAAIALLDRVRGNLKRHRAAVLQAAIEGRLGADVDRSGWSEVSLGDLLEEIKAGRSFKCIEKPPEPEEVGVVKVSAVTWGKFDSDESKTCGNPSFIRPEFFIAPGDFLFSRANTIDLVGACVIVRTVTRRLMLSDKILRLRLRDGVEPWVLVALRSRSGRAEIERLATGNQESMRNIGQERIRQIRLPLPPARERTRILESVDEALTSAAHVERMVSQSLRRASALRQSLLRLAFDGRLVPQNSGDEPASILLDRIRAERAANSPSPKKKPTRASR